MSEQKYGNCKICGQRCERKDTLFGIWGLLIGIPIRPAYICCDTCYHKWAGEGKRVWFGRKWFQHFITTLLVIGGIILVWKCMK